MILQSAANTQTPDVVSIICTGDIILDAPGPDHWLSGIAPMLQQADLVIGHLEVPHTHSSTEHGTDVPAPGAAPKHLDALKSAGFDVMTLAGNHVADCGEVGISDTIKRLEELGLAHCGAGPDITAARKPAIVNVKGRWIAVLSYNCVGPESAWARAERGGCAYLPVETASGEPVAPARQLTRPGKECIDILQEDIKAARSQAAVVIVALHKGIVHTPAKIAVYEIELAHAAIDAGADLVIGHHAHIIRGIESYSGKAIYHGLGNGCVVTKALDPDQAHPRRAEWAQRRKALFGFEPDPGYTLAPFHPEAVNSFMARLLWHADGTLSAGIVPVHVDPPGRPRLADAQESEQIRNYVTRITHDAGLSALTLQGNDIMVTT